MLLMITILAFYTYWLISGIVFLIDYKKHPQQCGYISNYNRYFNSAYRRDHFDVIDCTYLVRLTIILIVSLCPLFISIKYENVLRLIDGFVCFNVIALIFIAYYVEQFSSDFKALQETDETRYVFCPAVWPHLNNMDTDKTNIYRDVWRIKNAKSREIIKKHKTRGMTRRNAAIALVLAMTTFIVINTYIAFDSGYMDNEKIVFPRSTNIEKAVIFYDEIDYIKEIITHTDSVLFYIVTKDGNNHEISCLFSKEVCLRLRQYFELVIIRE